MQEAVEDLLRRRRRVEAFDTVVGSLANAGPWEWETSESTLEWVRALRRDWHAEEPLAPDTP